ncbi:hypothetical protein NDA01_17990 [Trichocoleus desertorum AS-A10]
MQISPRIKALYQVIRCLGQEMQHLQPLPLELPLPLIQSHLPGLVPILKSNRDNLSNLP